MNFFEQQDLAYKNTKRLLFLLALAVLSLVIVTTLLFGAVAYYAQVNAHTYGYQHVSLWQGITHALSWKVFFEIAMGVTAVVFLGGLYRFSQLSAGGRAVAESMGGRLINILNANADEKKILNVVEEMAIASGTPVPPVYVIEDEAINAFAAGYTPQDAVIGITRGCIRVLNRDELQGVIAHEFSHIFHGDMKLNMRLIALLYGILLLGLIGQFIFRSTYYTAGSNRKNGNALFYIGIGLMVIGYAGTFFGSLIKSGVSRQREFLADASAVKFTRNPDGIGGALKKLGGYVGGSQMEATTATEYSHMFFSEGIASPLFDLMATHPPLEARIRRIDPHWDGKFKQIDVHEENSYIEEGRSFTPIEQPKHGGKPIDFIPTKETIAKNPLAMAVMVDQVLQTMGQPTQAHVDYARATLNAITDDMHLAAHNPWDAQALMFGLLLDKDAKIQILQWQMLSEIFSPEQLTALRKWADRSAGLEAKLRLPLVEISLPALKNLSAPQYQNFKKALTQLIRADGKVNLMEWSFYSILIHNLEPKTTEAKLLDLTQLEAETALLLSVLANTGAEDAPSAQAAYVQSAKIIDNSFSIYKPNQYGIKDLDNAVIKLHALKPLQKPKLLKAMSQCVMADQKITVEEAELFRAIADALDCPVPPLLHQDAAVMQNA